MLKEIPHDLAIARIAGRQNGNITVAQLHEIGLNDRMIHYRVRRGRLFRVHPGVYSVGRPPRTPLERASAAVLACGPDAGLSHLAALALWGMATRWPHPPFDVTTIGDHRPGGVRSHRPKHLQPRDFRRHHDVRATSPARTILDCAPLLQDQATRRIVNDNLRAQIVSLTALDDVVGRFARHPGTKLLKPILDDAGRGLTDSPFEDELLDFCDRYGLPRPQTGVYIAGHRTDAVWIVERVIVECDGWGFHNTRERFERDRDRDADTLAAGFVTVRLTKRRLRAQPDREADRLHNILRQRRAR